METREPPRRSATLDEPDDMMREQLSPKPKPAGTQQPPKALILSGLALMLIVALVVTTAAVMQGLRAHSTGSVPSTPVKATATLVPTAVPIDPAASGWTRFTPYVFGGDLTFAPSSPQRGYVCGQGENQRIFGTTIDGGRTWSTKQSPAQYSGCSLQVSPTNPLDVVLVSRVEAGQAPDVEAHYSTDGGATWKTVPFPQTIIPPGGVVWSGSYLYSWAGPSTVYPQHNYLEVSANGGAFTAIDPSKLLPGVPDAAIQGALADGNTVYLNVGYSCNPLQSCQAIVASKDGGKTWTKIPNQSSIQIRYVAGKTLYGQAPDPQDSKNQIEMTSSDNGATWTPLKLPPIPGAEASAPFAFPAPDGTLFAAPDNIGVASLHGSTWTVLPFSAYGEYIRLAFGVDGSGKPQTVWAIDDGNGSQSGIYSHPLP